VPLKFM